MSGGRLTIEALPPGAVVPAFEVADAVNRGVLDMAHTRTYYFIGKHKATLMKTPDDVLVEYLEAWDKYAAAEAAKDSFFKKVLESQKAYAAVVSCEYLCPPRTGRSNHARGDHRGSVTPAASARRGDHGRIPRERTRGLAR